MYHLTSLKFIETCFMSQRTVYLGECFVCTRKECFLQSLVECSIHALKLIWLMMVFLNFLYPYWCSVDLFLSVTERGVLKILTVDINNCGFLFFPLVLPLFVSYILKLLYTFRLFFFLMNWHFYYYEMFYFVPDNISSPDGYSSWYFNTAYFFVFSIFMV